MNVYVVSCPFDGSIARIFSTRRKAQVWVRRWNGGNVLTITPIRLDHGAPRNHNIFPNREVEEDFSAWWDDPDIVKEAWG